MQKWVDNIKTVEDENIRLAIMTANILRNMIGLPEAKWKELKEGEIQEQSTVVDSKQHTLSEFLN